MAVPNRIRIFANAVTISYDTYIYLIMKRTAILLLALLAVVTLNAQHGPCITTASGNLEGIDSSGVKIFCGIPFAQPPVGELRWKAPQPVQPWTGVRQAKKFGPNPIQNNAFGDMVFGTSKSSEDCLYINVWTPTKTMDECLPVLIYFNGGGLIAGSGSEPRYQGLTLARKGIIVVTANYREGIFGFFAHPQLSKETAYHGSGNYGFMDQVAAIQWVKDNIKAFGGDPNRITINGESAGSMSVSALMASPMSRQLIHQVMASSGSVIGNTPVASLQQAEKAGEMWAKKNGFKKIADLRKLPAEKLSKIAEYNGMPMYCIDGKFFTEQPLETYRKGEQAQVNALIGNNSAEMPIMAFMGGKAPTIANLKTIIPTFFGTGVDADEILRLYGMNTDADLFGLPGYTMGGDLFIVYATWKWTDLLRQTSKCPVYRYLYAHPRPETTLTDKAPGLAGGTTDNKIGMQPATPGAVHSADIEYAMGNLPTNTMFRWNAEDYTISEIFQSFYLNFIKTGNPNGLGLPQWDAINGNNHASCGNNADLKNNAGCGNNECGHSGIPVMYIDSNSHQFVNANMEHRYQVIDSCLQRVKGK